MRVATLALLLFVRIAVAAPPIGKVPLPCKTQFAMPLPHGDRMMISCGDSARLLELPSGKEKAKWPVNRVSTVSASEDGSVVAIAERATIKVYRTSDARLVTTVPIAGPYLLVLEVAPDGKTLVAATVGHAPEVWSIAGKPKRLATLATDFGSASAAAWAHDGTRLAVATDDTAVRIYDAKSWQSVAEIKDRLLPTLALAWASDGKQLALGAGGGALAIVDAAGKTVRTFSRGDVVFNVMAVGDHWVARHGLQQGPTEIVSWSADGKATPLADKRTVSGRGVVRGALWLVTVTADSAELWTPTF